MVRIKERMLMRMYGWEVSTARKDLKERELEEAQTQARNADLAENLWGQALEGTSFSPQF